MKSEVVQYGSKRSEISIIIQVCFFKRWNWLQVVWLESKGCSFFVCRDCCLAFFFFQWSLNLFFEYGNPHSVQPVLKLGQTTRFGDLLSSFLPLDLSWLWSFRHGCSWFRIFICIRCYGITLHKFDFNDTCLLQLHCFYYLLTNVVIGFLFGGNPTL